MAACSAGSVTSLKRPRRMLTAASGAVMTSPDSIRVGVRRRLMQASGVPLLSYRPDMAKLSENLSYCLPSISMGADAFMVLDFWV